MQLRALKIWGINAFRMPLKLAVIFGSDKIHLRVTTDCMQFQEGLLIHPQFSIDHK